MKGKRVGVIGGGQLAWMMGAEAPKLGIELIVQADTPEEPAVSRAKQVVFAEVDDAKGTAELARLCDVITFENEFIDLPALRKLTQPTVFRPSLDSLAPLLDKYDQRIFLQNTGLPVPKFSIGLAKQDITASYGFPVVLKARRHGYDGQGTFIVRDEQALAALSQRVPLAELLVEEFIFYQKELAVIAARNASGETAIYPVTETFQKSQVCHWTITPADIQEDITEQIKEIACTILTQLDVVGVFGIELFLTNENQVLVNEIAPRTHNSGHYTLDACGTSQFAMQLRAVTDLPLGSTGLKSAGAVMVNLLGYEDSESDYKAKRDCEASRRHRILEIPQSFVHWYGKKSRPGRKLGHVTVLLDAERLTQAQSIISNIESIWYE